ncbi:MAG: diaminopimelate decarboxylase [Gammaproteobacteria bacterium WSBS_2016_MAG_OTU1]
MTTTQAAKMTSPLNAQNPTNGFWRNDGRLFVESLPLTEIAAQYGTPCYVYSQAVLAASLKRLQKAFAKCSPKFFYAVKANSNLSILRLMRDANCGFDIVSAGEMARVLAAGGAASDIVFSGVGKSSEEITVALSSAIGCFNVESASELYRIESIATKLSKPAPVSFRVTLDIDGGTHPHLTTGLKESKFGVSPQESLALATYAVASKHLDFQGFACHIGSQITSPTVYITAATQMNALRQQAQAAGIPVHHIDMGGGFAIDYKQSTGLKIDLKRVSTEYARHFNDVKLWVEPGRALTAPAGVLLTRVEYIKKVGGMPCWIVDAGMNDILRPMLYDTEHTIEAVEETGTTIQNGDIVGPICESADVLARNCMLSAEEGDLLAIRDAGAYCASMMSSYNSRLRACEVLVHGNTHSLIRRRETLEDMLASEQPLL